MRGWLRRNWVPLAALVVLLPATIGLTFSAQWLGYFATWPTQPTVVAVSQTAPYADAGWTVVDSERVAADSDAGRDAGLPEGTDLVSVSIRVEPDGESPFCSLALDELRDDTIERTWDTDQFYNAADRTGCDTDYSVPYSFEVAFLVPSDAGTDGTALAVNLSSPDELPGYLRLYF